MGFIRSPSKRKNPVDPDDRQQGTASYVSNNLEAIRTGTMLRRLSVRGTSLTFAVVKDTLFPHFYPYTEPFATTLQTHPPRPYIPAYSALIPLLRV
eukprot:TRINITY_DN110_c0_g1_i1.p1 TRINITY_DN110_c0_g1~~TRINITY_DN110_c0_g1_i1.p1  ORF type:complete len:96 (+),score=27.37 TRINITY_DN110_c0_g1_i1:103-390(+)